MSSLSSCFVAAFALGTFSAAAGAQPGGADARVTLESGGVSTEAREALERDARYNLKVVLATRSGQYMSDVKVTIVDSGGKAVASTLTEGPWLLAQLAPGPYRVSGEYRGVTQARDVVVARERRQEVLLQWPDELASEPARSGGGR